MEQQGGNMLLGILIGEHQVERSISMTTTFNARSFITINKVTQSAVIALSSSEVSLGSGPPKIKRLVTSHLGVVLGALHIGDKQMLELIVTGALSSAKSGKE
jgi:hypothetical protein